MKRTLVLILALLAMLSHAQQRVKVVGVSDGDTVRVLTEDKRELKVRLDGIDAPEKAQPFGERSRQWLSSQVFGKTLDLYAHGTDRYGRTLGTLKRGTFNVNRESALAGWAWWYRQYAPKRTDIQTAEAKARTAKRGIWSQGTAIEPWLWRRGTRTASATPSKRARPVLTNVKGTVWITDTGKRYHSAGCASLWNSRRRVTLKGARSLGLTACRRCGG